MKKKQTFECSVCEDVTQPCRFRGELFDMGMPTGCPYETGAYTEWKLLQTPVRIKAPKSATFAGGHTIPSNLTHHVRGPNGVVVFAPSKKVLDNFMSAVSQ